MGVAPDYGIMRAETPLEGRFLNAEDIEKRRHVVFLGYEAANRLFGNSPSVGETIRIGGGTSSFSFCSKRWRSRSSVACLE